MSTAPLLTESPLALLLDGATPAAEAQPDAHVDPYARWHGFMERAVRSNVVVASVSQLLNRRVGPAWAFDGIEQAASRLGRRLRR